MESFLSNVSNYPLLGEKINACKSQVENSSWHIQQSVLDHLEATYSHLIEILNWQEFDQNTSEKYERYLNLTVGSKTKRELLLLVASSHDLGKNEPNIRIEFDEVYDPFRRGHQLKRTAYKGHEEAGGLAIVRTLENSGLLGKDIDYVGFLITNHDYGHQSAEMVYKGGEVEMGLRRYKNYVGVYFPELLLLTLADMRGGTLESVELDEFQFRNDLLKRWIEEVDI